VNGAAHFRLSAVLAAPVALALTRDPAAALGVSLAVGFAALLPDLDHRWALASRPLRAVGLSGVLQAHIGHRSVLTHSLAACAGWALWWLVLALALGLPWPLPLWAGGVVLAGGWLHVAEDWVPWGSRAGVPLLWPLSRRRLKFRPRSARHRRAVPVP
jgi:membrane-bound metal-dependent hydrolase YbcI (DUF457 family)